MLKRLLLYPILFSLFPVLSLAAYNIAEISLDALLRPFFVSLSLSLVLFGLARWILRDWQRAALLSTILLVLFFSYGQVYILLKGVNISGFYLFRHRTLVPLWFLLAALAIWWTSRKGLQPGRATYALNVIGLFLLVVPVFQLISFSVQSRVSQAEVKGDAATLALQVQDPPRDIYYIILDGYGRADVLQNEYGYDNSDFLDTLRDMGFVIADCSMSNYAQTQMSLASSLNFNYIDALSDRFVAGSEDRAGLDVLIHDSAVRKSLEKAGYKTVAFATGFLATELTDADYFLGPGYSWGELNEFEALLMETTFARLIQDGNRFGMQTSGSERFRERTLFTLEKLDELSYIEGPKFVFVHLIVPHPPYVFGPTGGPVEPAEAGTTRTQEGASHYRDQVIYVNSRLMEILPQLIANSSTPPMIVIQGDHGPTVPSSPRARMSNLNAYFLPGVAAPVYPTVTPVNTFRIIFNAYFGQDLELLDDVSLYSEYDDPFNWRAVPNSCIPNQ
jgi:hypothetical protein